MDHFTKRVQAVSAHKRQALFGNGYPIDDFIFLTSPIEPFIPLDKTTNVLMLLLNVIFYRSSGSTENLQP